SAAPSSFTFTSEGIANISVGQDKTSFFLKDTLVGDWQVEAKQGSKPEWQVAIQTYTISAAPIDHMAFITPERRLIAGTTIQFVPTDTNPLGTSTGTITVRSRPWPIGSSGSMPLTLYDNRVATITVITVELRDVFGNVTTSTENIWVSFEETCFILTNRNIGYAF
ncbi:unnamed protein product, partial [marine sediment metagenome]